MLDDLLTQYSRMFTTGDSNVRRTTLVEHSIPLVKNVQPVRQPRHRPESDKEAEADRQLADLLQRCRIELCLELATFKWLMEQMLQGMH